MIVASQHNIADFMAFLGSPVAHSMAGSQIRIGGWEVNSIQFRARRTDYVGPSSERTLFQYDAIGG
jgi:hypothetical protein